MRIIFNPTPKEYNMNELKCPVCGSKDIAMNYGPKAFDPLTHNGWFLSCKDCNYQSSNSKTPEQAIQSWNIKRSDAQIDWEKRAREAEARVREIEDKIWKHDSHNTWCIFCCEFYPHHTEQCPFYEGEK
jgi:Lar family restriction alleviation protein